MSFFDDASLVFLPSGQAGKDGKAYSMKPTDGSGDFTFSRGSNLTATRVDSNGLIEKGRENLLLQSNSFDTTWTISEGTILGGQSGYDGSSNAWLYTDNVGTTSKSHDVRQSVSESGVNCFSIYAKMGTKDWVKMYNGLNTCYFNIDPNYVGNRVGTDGTLGGSVEDVGNGWFRLSVFDNGSASLVLFGIAGGDGSGNYISDGTGTLYIQSAQLEIGLTSTEYIESGATTGKAGILEDSPRFDYSGGASCPSLLLEPSRTNLIGQSEYFGDSSWTKTGGTSVATNSITSPDGTQNASTITGLSGTGSNDLRFGTSINPANKTYTASVYLKGSGTLRIQMSNNVDNAGSTIVTLTSSWVRYELTKTFNATAGALALTLDDSGATAAGYDIFGAQLEEGSYQTSYIPNHSGGSVTRNADELNDLDISSMLTSSSFTWFLDLNDYIGSDVNQETIFLESSPNLKIQLRVRPDGYRFYYNNIAGGSTYPIAGSTTANKFCVSYDGNDYRLYVDGTLEATTRSVGDSGWDYIKNAIAASLPLKQMLLFPSKLSDAECITLTS